MERFKNQRVLIIAMAFVTVFFLLQLRVYQSDASRRDEIKQISIVAYGSDTERWENLKQGAETACTNSGAEVFLVTMTESAGAGEQAELIEREVDNGADAVIVIASDSKALPEYYSKIGTGKPVIFAETGMEGHDGECVSADNYQLGVNLAKKIMENEHKWVKVAIVSDNLKRNSVAERYQGIYDTLSGHVNDIVIWGRNNNETNMLTRKYLQRCLVEEAVDVIVTLDTETTDSLMDALDNLNKSSKVYSIANSDKAVSYLDHNKIKALEYQDEFGVGYVAASRILEKLQLDAPEVKDVQISAKVITQPEIYDDSNQKLLFPFAK